MIDTLCFDVVFEEDSQDINVQLSNTDETLNSEFDELQIVVQSNHSDLTHREDADAHPISAITGLEGALGAIKQDTFYTHVQATASNEWTVIHNLNKMPSVSIVDSAKNVVIGDIEYIDENSLIVRFRGSFSGKCYCN